MKTSDFYYDLPQELIAQTPLERRDSSRLMVLHRETGKLEHRHFYDIVDYLQPGDCLVMNDSRVLPARLLGHRVPTGGAVELLLDCFSPLALEEFRRVLSPGGTFLYVVPAADHLWQLKEVLYDHPYPNEEKK